MLTKTRGGTRFIRECSCEYGDTRKLQKDMLAIYFLTDIANNEPQLEAEAYSTFFTLAACLVATVSRSFEAITVVKGVECWRAGLGNLNRAISGVSA